MLSPPFDMPDVLIISYPRSGTHFLESALKSHPQIRGRGECFLRYFRHFSGDTLVKHHDSDLFTNVPTRVNLGILMYGLVDYARINIGEISNQRIVHLLRDPISVAKSEVQKRANRLHYGVYSSHYRIGSPPPPNRPIAMTDVLSIAELVNAEQLHYRDRLRCYPKVLTITYEELTNNLQTFVIPDDISYRILDFLGIERSQLRTHYLKTGVHVTDDVS